MLRRIVDFLLFEAGYRRLRNEESEVVLILALLREELRIKDCRMAGIPATTVPSIVLPSAWRSWHRIPAEHSELRFEPKMDWLVAKSVHCVLPAWLQSKHEVSILASFFRLVWAPKLLSAGCSQQELSGVRPHQPEM
jgi:hypothetical protein